MDQEGNGVYSFDQEAGGSGHVPSSVDVGAAEAAASGGMVVEWEGRDLDVPSWSHDGSFDYDLPFLEELRLVGKNKSQGELGP